MDSIDLADAEAIIELFGQAAAIMLESDLRVGCVHRLPARGRLLATGDLHDNPLHLAKIVALAGLERSSDRHVIFHEMIHGERLINGLDFSYRMLARVAALVREYPRQVHPILANHELAQMTGRGVSKGAGNSVELFNDALGYIFSDAAAAVREAIRRFIAAMPLAVQSESGLLCAHSLPAAQTMKRFDPDILGRPLAPADYQGPDGSAYLMVWGRRYTEESVEQLAARWGVKLFCLGHVHVETGIETWGQRVVLLNSDHERAAVVGIDLESLPTPTEALMGGFPLASIS